MTPWLELVGGRNPHQGTKALWKRAVTPQKVPGYSITRWHASAEIQFMLAENFDKLTAILAQLNQLGYGDASREKLNKIMDSSDGKRKQLRLQLAGMLDMRALVRTSYELEGDRLELLLVHDRIESLRSLGNALRG